MTLKSNNNNKKSKNRERPFDQQVKKVTRLRLLIECIGEAKFNGRKNFAEAQEYAVGELKIKNFN